jgi:hypothetical protein
MPRPLANTKPALAKAYQWIWRERGQPITKGTATVPRPTDDSCTIETEPSSSLLLRDLFDSANLDVAETVSYELLDLAGSGGGTLPYNIDRLLVRPCYKELYKEMTDDPGSYVCIGSPGIGE